jgi:hypothetical protein
MTDDERIGLQQKRREAFLRMIAVFSSLSAAAVTVFFILRLVQDQRASDQKVRSTADSEREYFETKVSPLRAKRDDTPTTFSAAPRVARPKPDAVDMSAPGPLPRPEPEAPVRRNAPAVTERAAPDTVPREAPGTMPRQAPAAVSHDAPPAEVAPKTLAVVAESKGIERLEEKQAVIGVALRDFFNASSVVEMLPFVRDARRVGPLMDEYYQRSRIKKRSWKGLGWSIPIEEPGYRFAYVQAMFTDSPPVNVVIEETAAGFLVDWESSVQYSEIGWREFMASRPVEPKVFRVIASRVDDGSGKATLSLKHPQESGEVIGRFDPQDPRFRSLVEQLDLCKWKDVPVILRLCYPGPTAAANQVQIAGVEGKGWLILGVPGSGS